MRARLHTPRFRLEFDGAPALWNDFLRPLVGGPVAPAEEAPSAHAPATAPSVFAPMRSGPATPADPPAPARTTVPQRPYGPPAGTESPRRFDDRQGPRRDHGPDRSDAADRGVAPDRAWHPRHGGLQPTLQVAPSSDPRVLYDRLSTIDSRRGERDAVLAAIWFLGSQGADVAPEDVERHFKEHGGPPDVKVRPVMLKHVTRTKLLEQGSAAGTVRLTPKGVAQARMLVGV